MNPTLWAKIFGIVFVLIGVLGFVPALTPDGMLLGLFEVNTLHNIVHLVTGIAGLAVMKSASASKKYFQVFGIVYLLVTILGLVTGNALALGLVPVNGADNILHILITIVALAIGFGGKKRAAAPAEPAM